MMDRSAKVEAIHRVEHSGDRALTEQWAEWHLLFWPRWDVHEGSITKSICSGSDRCKQQTKIINKKGSRLGSGAGVPKASVGVRREKAGRTEERQLIKGGQDGWKA